MRPLPDETRVDADGMKWNVYRGKAPSFEGVEKLLESVKQLYAEKTGQDVDAYVDADGTTWEVSGRPTINSLEKKLEQIKELYHSKTGEIVDGFEETCVDADGTTWNVSRGKAPTMEGLQRKLLELKALYAWKVGGEVSDEDEDEIATRPLPDETCVDADGLTWNAYRGSAPTFARLEKLLDNVKELYTEKIGLDADAHTDADGTTWEVSGRPTINSLEKKLEQVKELYHTKTGEIVDGFEETRVDADGTTWNVCRGKAPTPEKLQRKLLELKALYAWKVGGEVSDEDEEEAATRPLPDETRVDADGTTWSGYRGQTPSFARLEKLLENVKELYTEKTGLDADAHMDADGTTWEVSRGKTPTMEGLERKLEQVKELYHIKTGEIVDGSEDTVVDADGTTWNVSRGKAPTPEQLQRKLLELKALYAWKVGGEVSDEDEEEVATRPLPDETRLDADGMAWNVYRGKAPTLESLEQKLQSVKELYAETTGEDVDSESGSEESYETRIDADGTVWDVYRGRAPTMGSLEKKLEELKQLYRRETGDSVDSSEETHVDVDGTTWNVYRGKAPSMEQLERKLQEVKALFAQEVGEDVDEDEEASTRPLPDESQVDSDGTMWNIYRGKTPTLETLEEKLASVKQLFAQKTGMDVDADGDVTDGKYEVRMDEDGTTWHVYRGKTPTLESLEKKLAEVKLLYRRKRAGGWVEDEPKVLSLPTPSEEMGGHKQCPAPRSCDDYGSWFSAGDASSSSSFMDRLPLMIRSLWQ
eukprot:TRINITY_DN568_c0_g1_i2.p1 TRINITY_DN568_c0_g1~~TRINITY_DN568_c0_g1_i2.p1  ORF type:complete len:760 (-),score=241.85 TRINITY_DN568_c0_g1_i2:379-2658(-)